MAAISSNGTGGGNWSSGASWSGGAAPGAGDTVTILNGDTITVDDTSRTCLRITINATGTLKASRIANNTLVVGDGTSDTCITCAGLIDYGTTADPIPASFVATLTFNPLNANATASQGNLTFTGTTITSGLSFVGDRNYAGVAETYTDPETGTVYNTRRLWSGLTADLAAAATSLTLVDDLKCRVNDSIVIPGANTTIGNISAQTETKSITSYATNNVGFTALTYAHQRYQLLDGATVKTELKVYLRSSNVIVNASGAKYWGYTFVNNTNPIFDWQNTSFIACWGSTIAYTISSNAVIQGCIFIGTPSGVGSAQLLRGSTKHVNCVFDSMRFSSNTFNSKIMNCYFGCSSINSIDQLQASGTYIYDSYFTSGSQPISSSGGAYVYRCQFFQVATGLTSSGGLYSEDCVFHRVNTAVVSSSGSVLIRPIFGSINYSYGNSQTSVYFDSPKYLSSPVITVMLGLTDASALQGNSSVFNVDTPIGVTAPSNIGITGASGGVIYGFTTATAPETVTPVPSGSTIVNKLVTSSSIEPASATARSFRPRRVIYKIPCTADQTFSVSVALNAVSGYTPTSLQKISLQLQFPDGSALIETTAASLPTLTWQNLTATGIPTVSGIATVTIYVQANIGGLYIDYPVGMLSSGYIWANGQPNMIQTPLATPGLVADVAAAVREELTTELAQIQSINSLSKLIPGAL